MIMTTSSSTLIDRDPLVEQWDATRRLPSEVFSDLRHRMMLEGCKWDPQIGDTATLAPFPLVIPSEVARTLGEIAECLTAEAVVAERVVLEHPECLKILGILGMSRVLRKALGGSGAPTPAAARVIRYDFHPTPEGWKISEANTDVPGGYTESSLFPSLMAENCPGTEVVGDPAVALVEAIIATSGTSSCIGLLSATGHIEDQQVTAYLAGLLSRRGCSTVRAHPRQIIWDEGIASIVLPDGRLKPLDALVRFYQGEWLERGTGRNSFVEYFRGGRTPVCNPGTALIIESKRFPLVWDRLGLELPTWRALLPPTFHPRSLKLRSVRRLVLKTAFCNTGDTVALSDGPDRKRWNGALWSASLSPGQWVAQSQFDILPIPTPAGQMYPCLGVYTINGRAAGIFGRMGASPLIDLTAIEVAVLINTRANKST